MTTAQSPHPDRRAAIEYRELASFGELIDAIRLRVDIFIIEQACPPGWEPDEHDKTSVHYIALDQGVVVATVRLHESSPGALKLERMVVRNDRRGRGIGTGLTRYVVGEALRRRPGKLWMEAQRHAQHFYERSGFRVTSEAYDLHGLGIPHVAMEYVGLPDHAARAPHPPEP